jgi:hypothetical protein
MICGLANTIGSPANSLAGLRILDYGVFAAGLMFEFEIVGVGSGPVLVQCRPDLAICHGTLLSTRRLRRRRESGHARTLIDCRGSVEGRNSGARTLLVLLRDQRARDAATTLDRASSAYRQPTSNSDRGEARRVAAGALSDQLVGDGEDALIPVHLFAYAVKM